MGVKLRFDLFNKDFRERQFSYTGGRVQQTSLKPGGGASNLAPTVNKRFEIAVKWRVNISFATSLKRFHPRTMDSLVEDYKDEDEDLERSYDSDDIEFTS